MTEKLILKALIAAKKEFKPLVKNKVNPHFKSKYADLSAVAESVDEALAKHGLTYVQPCERAADGTWTVNTKLTHVEGEELVSGFPLPANVRPQELGSAITYGRRFSLCSLLGISADDDDDGNAASTSTPSSEKKQESPKDGPQKWIGTIKSAEKEVDGANKFLHVIGDDGTDLILVQPSEDAKARMDIYNMLCLDIAEAMAKKAKLELTWSLSPRKNKIIGGVKKLNEKAVA